MKWEEMFSGKYFITNLGQEQIVENEKEKIVLGQYAVWAPFTGGTNHQIVEIGDNQQILMEKYNVPEDRVCTLIQE